MKKILALLLAGMIIFSFAGCGPKDIAAEYANMTAEELISETIKDRANPTDEEIAASVAKLPQI